jgi:hypothetical protein
MPGEAEIQVDGQELSQQGGKDPLHPKPERDADQSAYQAEQDGLEQIDAQDVRGSRAYRLHDGKHFHPLLQMGPHGHRHSNCAQYHGYQADQAE